MNLPVFRKLQPLLERLLSLLVVFLMIAATAVWTGRLFGQPIGQGRQSALSPVAAPDTAVLSRLGLAGTSLEQLDSAAWTVTARDGKERGTLVSSERYASGVSGFAGPVPVYIYIDAQGVVAGIAPARNAETRDFFERARADLIPRWTGKSVAEATAVQVDGVTGATYSSRGLIETVRRTLSARQEVAAARSSAPAIGWGRTAALGLVLLLGVGVAWRSRVPKAARLAVLVLNVVVTGFWCGQFLSLSLLRGWASGGLDPVLYLPGLLLLLVAIVMPLLGRPRYFCNWVCPYGALQELAWRLPLPKWHVRPQTYKMLRNVRLALLMALLLLLWSGFGAYLLDYEPFTAFLVQSATPAVIILAAFFVVLGIFVPTPWCRAVCPVGALLELAEGKK